MNEIIGLCAVCSILRRTFRAETMYSYNVIPTGNPMSPCMSRRIEIEMNIIDAPTHTQNITKVFFPASRVYNYNDSSFHFFLQYNNIYYITLYDGSVVIIPVLLYIFGRHRVLGLASFFTAPHVVGGDIRASAFGMHSVV